MGYYSDSLPGLARTGPQKGKGKFKKQGGRV